MKNTDKGTDTIGDGGVQSGKHKRSQKRKISVAARRLLVFVLIFLGFIGLSGVLSILVYIRARDSDNQQLLSMLASVLAGGLIIQLGLDFVRKLIGDFIAIVRASFQRDSSPFRKRLFGLWEHAFSLFLCVFALLVLGGHYVNKSDIAGFREYIKNEVTRAITEQGYTRERAVVHDLLPSLQDSFIYARIPIFFNVAELDPNSGGVVTSEDDFIDGVKYIDDKYEYKISVGDLIDSLKPCGTKDTPVRLRVEGFASSKRFNVSGNNDQKESDRLNLLVANFRRCSVEKALQTKIDDEKLGELIKVVRGKDYESIEEMKIFRRFNDRPTGGNMAGERREAGAVNRISPRQDLFTRTAHILILELSKCREPRWVGL